MWMYHLFRRSHLGITRTMRRPLTSANLLARLFDNRIEEVFPSPDIVNPLSVSVQSSGNKRLILDLRHINLQVYKQTFRRKDFSKDCISFSPLLWSLDTIMWTFFLIIGSIWLSPGILATTIQDISSLLFYLSVFPVRLLFSTKLLKTMEAHWRSQGIPMAIFLWGWSWCRLIVRRS